MSLPPAAVPLLLARELAFSRGDEPVFGPLDFELDAGEALLVRGGNVDGTTTLATRTRRRGDCRPDRTSASRWRACCSSARRCGCSTSLTRTSTSTASPTSTG